MLTMNDYCYFKLVLYIFRMVQYIVKSKDKIPKWTIVELQGKLEVRNGTQEGTFDGRYTEPF